MFKKKEDQLSELIKENQEQFYRIAFSYMKNEEDALDALQNAIVKAFQKHTNVRKSQYLKTWFCRVLINECLTLLKRKERILYTDQIEEYQKVEDSLCGDVYDITIHQAIETLDNSLKNIVILRFFHDMKIEEIAQITNTNVNTTKSRLYKALTILKKVMEEHNE